MAVSVLSAAGVVTTQKAAAQSAGSPIVVDYKPGATYSYTPKQFNLKFTGAMVSPGTKHFEAATGGAAYSSMRTTQTQAQASYNRAQVGTGWKLNLNGADWADVQTKPCKVTVKVNYHIEAKGISDTTARAYWGPMIMAAGGYDYVIGNNPVHAKSAVTTTTWQGTVGDLFALYPDGSYHGAADAEVRTDQDSAGAGQASAAITCSSIVLEFLPTS